MNNELDIFLTGLPLSRKSEIITMLLNQVSSETSKKPRIPLSNEEDELVERISQIEQNLNPAIENYYINNFSLESRIQNTVRYNVVNEIDNYKLVSLFLTKLVSLSNSKKLDESDADFKYCLYYLTSLNFKTYLRTIQHYSKIMYEKKLKDYDNGNYPDKDDERDNEDNLDNSSCPACHENPCMCSDPQNNW